MDREQFATDVCRRLGHSPSADQWHAIDVFGRFMADRSAHVAMIMRGSAGTGKTSLASAMVQTLQRMGQKMVLLAPTGRAAKVFSLHSGAQALTIHRKIYRERSLSQGGGVFNLNDNLHKDTLFVVDEASMIANQGSGGGTFGSGRLLDDLMSYVYGGRNCRLLVVGDHAQLPPVGESESPALQCDVVGGYGLNVYETTLSEVVRQDSSSGILYNATALRTIISHNETTQMPRIRLQGFADISVVRGSELIEQLQESYYKSGVDETMVIVRSNKQAKIYNMGIRARVMDREGELEGGDRIMIVKNHYGIGGKAEQENHPFTFIANGDCAIVQRVRGVRELYGFRFADVRLRFPDYDDYEMQTTVVLDSLASESPALSREQMDHLYESVMADYADISHKAERIRRVREDVYFNALQVKFAYAVTCHKAQGGQWSHVYLDQGYMTDEMLSADYLHWLYTAFTRATERLYLVNWPTAQTL